jgi:hypothetical protein
MNEEAYDKATLILKDAAAKIQSCGLHVVISRAEMRQGMTISLHFAETKDAVAAAYVAMGHGSQVGLAKNARTDFDKAIEEVLESRLIDRTLD